MKDRFLPFAVLILLLFLTCEKERPEITDFSDKITISTSEVDSVEYRRAIIRGSLGETFNRDVQDYGHCWDTIPEPEITKHYTSNGSPKDSVIFTSILEDLLPDRQYYARAYFIIDDQVAYSQPVSFNTRAIGMPVVETESVKFITITSITCGGNVLQANDDSLVARGLCWNKIGNPTINDDTTLNGMGLGKFTAIITDLSVNTKYYLRAYAINTKNTNYGKLDSFITERGIPVLSTTSASEIYATSAKTGGTINYNGGYPITSKGVCWSTLQNPTLQGKKTSDGTGTGSFESSLTELQPGTLYYIKAYAINSIGPGYGDQDSFMTRNGIPKLEVSPATNITATSALSGGSVTDDGGSAIIAKGVCWSTSTGPTVENTKTLDGNGADGFTSVLSGLSVNTKYYLKAYAINSIDTGYSIEVNFTTKDGLPIVNTASVTNITDTSAVSGGNITNDGGFPVTARGVCWNSSQNPTIDNSKTLDGTGSGIFTSNLKDLSPKTIYYVRAYATNVTGTTYGDNQTFTTSTQAPEANTCAATDKTTTTATLNGSVNAHDSSTTVTFEYGTTTSYGMSISATPGTLTGNTLTAVSAGITGLTPNTTYHFRVKAVNSGGTDYGNDQSFTTSTQSPEANTNEATNKTATTATLNGSVNAHNSSTTVTFEYGTTISYGMSISATPGTLTGNTLTVVSAGLTGLDPNTTYHFRVKAVNSGGTDYGNDQSFTTSTQSPEANTNEATNKTATTATLNGSVNAHNSSTTVTFEYGINTSYGMSISATPGTLTGNTLTVVSAGITGLDPNTTYHFRVKAVSSEGTDYGNDLTFITDDGLPTVLTYAITKRFATAAYLEAFMTTDGVTPVNYKGFCWSTTSMPDTFDFKKPAYYGIADEFQTYATGLSPNTTYYVRAYIIDSEKGLIYGNQISFTTLSEGSTNQIGTLTDTRDNRVYNTVLIGSQWWMAENLNYGTQITSPTAQTNNSITEKYCYNNNASNCANYGALYQWNELMNYSMVESTQGICPLGWHIPSDSEWKTLEMSLGMSSSDADNTGWRGQDQAIKLRGNESSGFNSIDAGAYFYFNSSSYIYSGLGSQVYYWTSSFISNAWFRRVDMSTSGNGLGRWGDFGETHGFYVRCVKD
jgi:uncharacterized protein (TIGR02145 family)